MTAVLLSFCTTLHCLISLRNNQKTDQFSMITIKSGLEPVLLFIPPSGYMHTVSARLLAHIHLLIRSGYNGFSGLVFSGDGPAE